VTKDERRLAELKLISGYLKYFFLGGLGFVLLRYLFPFITTSPHVLTGQAWVAISWALAWTAAGFVLGFLFGIPKVSQKAPRSSAQDPDSITDSQDDEGRSSPYPLRVNTNLEDISDWLTKILVGATLTQLLRIPGLLKRSPPFTKGLKVFVMQFDTVKSSRALINREKHQFG
jgi:hypothetical protein